MHTPPDIPVKKQPHAPSRNSILAVDQSLLYLAFYNTLQPNIITTVSTGILAMANNAACVFLGYSHKELMTKSIADIFDIGGTSLQNMLKQRRADGSSKALLTAITKTGKAISCEITSAIFKDENNIERAITTISDLSQRIRSQKRIDAKKEKAVAADIVTAKKKQHKIDVKKKKIVADNIVLAKLKSDVRLAENNEWIKYIAKTSYDVMWDWDIATGEIYIGDSAEETFGYKVQNNGIHFRDFIKSLLPDDKNDVEKRLWDTLGSTEKSWNDAYRIKRYNGSVAATISRASIIRDDKGKAIRLIGATQDISIMRELENKLGDESSIKKDNSDMFNLAAGLYYNGIWEWNIVTGEFFLGEGFDTLFGYSYNNTNNIVYDWNDFLHPDDKEVVENAIKEALASSATQWKQTFRFIKADGSVANVSGRASIIRDTHKKACRMIGVIHDFSKQQELEEKLDREIKLKEQQITDAIEEAKDAQRSDIGRELHDNVNQLLGASTMFLEMSKKKAPNSEIYLSRSSQYTMMAIEEIRKLTKGLTTDIIRDFGLSAAIDNITKDTMEASRVSITCDMESFVEHEVNDKFKLNAFRIVQEQLTNILKHANAGMVNITLAQNEKSVLLTITDDGIGFDTSVQPDGIGIANINSRSAVYNGVVNLISEPGKGCSLSIVFPITGLIKKHVN